MVFRFAKQKKRTPSVRFLSNSFFELFDLDCSACCCEVSFHLFSVFLGNAFLDRLRSCFYEFLSFLESEACELTNCLDNVELAFAERSENNVELCLFFLSCRCGSCCAACNRYGSRGYAEFLFEDLNNSATSRIVNVFICSTRAVIFSDAMI